MANFNGKYEYARHENFDKYLTSIGVPEEKVKGFLSAPKKPTIEIIVKGDEVTLKRTGGLKDYDVTFTLGKEHSEELFGFPVKAVTTKDGDKIKTIATSERGQTEVISELVGSELIYNIKDLKNNVACKRIYKKL